MQITKWGQANLIIYINQCVESLILYESQSVPNPSPELYHWSGFANIILL